MHLWQQHLQTDTHFKKSKKQLMHEHFKDSNVLGWKIIQTKLLTRENFLQIVSIQATAAALLTVFMVTKFWSINQSITFNFEGLHTYHWYFPVFQSNDNARQSSSSQILWETIACNVDWHVLERKEDNVQKYMKQKEQLFNRQ